MVPALVTSMTKPHLFFIIMAVGFASTLCVTVASAQSTTTIPNVSPNLSTSAAQSQKIKEALKKKRDARKLALKNKREKAKQLQAQRKNSQQQNLKQTYSKSASTTSAAPTKLKPSALTEQNRPTYEKTKTVVPTVTELNTTPALLNEPAENDSIVKFSLDLGVSYEQQTEASDDGSQAKGLGFEVIPKVKIGDYSLSAKVVYAYNTVEPEQSEFADGLISARYTGWHLFPSLKLAPSLSVELPFSKESRENRGIIYVANTGLSLSLDTKYLDIEKYALSYSVSYGHFSNEFTTRENGDPAVKYKIVQTVATSYDFDPISIGLKLQFASNYSYDDVVRNGFLHVEYIGFKHTEILSYSIYHYNTGPLLKGTNYENNLKAYDKDSSIVGVSIDLSL